MLRRIYRVGEVTGYIRDLLESDSLLSDIWIRGEISNFKYHTSGHMYFTLKDDSSSLRCVMFRSRACLLNFLPANGMNVLVRGYVGLYERDGNFQLYVEELEPDGMGALYLAYCRLRDRLEAEGLFAVERKKTIPLLPRKVGVVTSRNGAAWRDIVTVIRRRFPQMPVVLAPASVQGEQAPGEIRAALALLDRRDDIDVVIVGRGGGSLEELWAFNTEEVARAIYRMHIPVVSAVGHETDFTIADFVADVRAPTPSAAAEMVVPQRRELERQLLDLKGRLIQAVNRDLRDKRARIVTIAGHRLPRATQNRLLLYKRELSSLNRCLIDRMRAIIGNRRSNIERLAGKMDALSPLAIIKRGYGICRDHSTGKLIRTVEDTGAGRLIDVILGDGSLHCLVKDVKEDPHGGNSL